MKQTKTIGSILMDVELVTQEDIEQALELQKTSGRRLGEVLMDLGMVSDDDIRWALAEQLNLPYVNIRKDQIDVDVASLLPEKLARRYHVIPILKIDDELTVVVDDPLNTTVIEDIEKITKSQVKISLGRTSDILLAIDEIYGSSKDTFLNEQETPPRFLSSWFDEKDIQKVLNDPSGQILMELILDVALAHHISRIYFQPGADACYVSYRVHGVLQQQVQMSQEWYSILLFRLKISADFEMAEARHPQYRELAYTENLPANDLQPTRTPVTVAVSILPTAAGESVVLSVIHKTVDDLYRKESVPALQEKELLEVRKLQTTFQLLKTGAIFLGGSPFLDKMTSLYALLNQFDPVRKKIVTLDSHSEYRADQYYQIKYSGDPHFPGGHEITSSHDPSLEDFGQESHARSSAGKTGTALPSVYRPQVPDKVLSPDQERLSSWLSVIKEHDTDVLLVDHIASDVVLSQCLDFAGLGLLLASLDFSNVFQMLTYFLDCQVKPSVMISRVYALMAQQSIRILCQECKQKDSTALKQQILERFHSAGDEDPPQIYASGGGCPACHMAGYVHQVVLFESLALEPWLKNMLLEGSSLANIQQMAEEKEFQSLAKKSLDLLFSGQTSLEEVFSIIT